MRAWLDAEPRRAAAVVVGGGYIGVEMAEAMVQRGLDGHAASRRDPQPMSTVDPDMGALVRDAMCGLGIDVRTGVTVPGLEQADGRVSAVVTDDGHGAGRHRGPGSGRTAQHRARRRRRPARRGDRRRCAPTCGCGCPGVDGVWAAGDCVETVHLVTGQPVHIPLGTHANKQGRVAGINIGGGYATFPGVVGTAVTKVCDLEVARTGLTERRGRGGRLRVRDGDGRVDHPGRLLPRRRSR